MASIISTTGKHFLHSYCQIDDEYSILYNKLFLSVVSCKILQSLECLNIVSDFLQQLRYIGWKGPGSGEQGSPSKRLIRGLSPGVSGQAKNRRRRENSKD